MFALSPAASFAVALLIPFWWALGLFILACLGDVSPRLRPGVRRMFDWLERTRVQPPNAPAMSPAAA
jgi:hypothetical protein